MNSKPFVQITVELTDDQAWVLALFLKRAGFSTYQECAQTNSEAYLMIDAAHRLMHALDEKGYAPR